MKKVFLLLTVAALSLQSCATVFSAQHTKNVPVRSMHDGVEVYVNGIYMGEDVTTIEVQPKDVVTFEKEGFKPQTIIIKGKFNAVSLINLLDPTLIVGWIVDAATGNITKVKNKQIQVRLKESMMKQ